MKEVIRTEALEKSFKLGKIDVPVLFGIDISIKEGEFVALCGSSGSGKSTLLNLIGGLAKPSAGKIRCLDYDIGTMNENELSLFRRKNVGFIFQSYNLLPDLTAIENVELPLVFAEISRKERRKMAVEVLELMGLSDRMKHKPNELSGGQQQRVSIARALVNKPSLILADEPTGNLDSHIEKEIIDLMVMMNKKYKKTFVVVTHDESVAKRASRVIYLRDGLVDDEVEYAGKENAQ